MLSMDAVTAYALTMGLLVIFLLVWLVHRQRTAQGFNLWLVSGVVGMLLGSAASYAMVMASGHIVVVSPKHLPPPDAGGGALAANTAAGGSGMVGMAPSGPPTAPPSGSGGGGMGGGMGGGGRPNPKRDLTTLVRKLNLLTDDIAIKLNSDQTKALVKELSGVDDAEKFSDDDAKKMYDDLFAVLSDEQKAKLDAVGLPFGGRPGGGGGGGMGGGGMGGGAPPDPDANPFKQENNLKALKSFRSRFDSVPPADTEAPK